MNNNESTNLFGSNETNALLGLPSNILLLVILMRIGSFSRRQSVLARLSFIKIKSTGSFERFLFEVVFIDTLLIIYHFVDNFLSYIHEDRSTGQHYLIHVSDFCCKFFTYIAKMSVLLTTWLLLFLIINQLILTMEHNNQHHRSCWNRGLYYVNAKYSTVFLVFIFSVYNIYPIEVLKYKKKEDLQDYQKVEGVPGVCSTQLEGKSTQLLNITNYSYNLLGVAIPCVIILIISIIIIYRTCRNNTYMNKECASFYYIAGTIGIMHALFNLPARLSDLLLLFSSAYVSFYPYLINFNHEAQSFIYLSYGYKCFICILISRRFRLHAKSVLCFLIESKYEDRYTTERFNATNDWHHIEKLKTPTRYYHHQYHGTDSYKNIIPVEKPLSRKFPFSHINKEDLQRFITSETTSWIRPYFTQNEKHNLLRPCGRSVSCHELSIPFSSIPSNVVEVPNTYSPNELNTSSSHIITDSSSSYNVSIALPNGDYAYLPLPQKQALNYRLSSASSSKKNKNDPSSHKDSLKMTLFSENVKEQPINRINLLSSSHIY
ncbi:unnamed protein product [Rotaria sordida]|uniref:G-protein coupled receptors family 1 profile domain-containing protein n=1 Tax=Rotaria sordida TaxID=392033 RepID=A0A813ZHD5_9BILA|nr:unnamed protein product [Rotaria sordida]CAF0942278.1 unnamed protein product [Rotaria sordida]CAF3601732.1 unnamed protein product [Rotaria sordida]CAF3681781.1 unnamed protein product [Rotaria sordida]